MSYREAQANKILLTEVNRRWPNRSRASDGWIGDAAHASRNSDHNPWLKVDGVGVVRARDFTAEGIDADWLAEYLRSLGKVGDPRLNGGGYIIWNRRIASERQNWAWRSYSGSNPHTQHVHLSLSRNQGGFDSAASWRIDAAPTPEPKDWLDMASKQEVSDLIDERLAVALGPKSKLQVAQDVRSIKRHAVDGPDPRKGSDRSEMTWPQRVTEALRRIESK